jgi:hypothetical protein
MSMYSECKPKSGSIRRENGQRKGRVDGAAAAAKRNMSTRVSAVLAPVCKGSVNAPHATAFWRR